MKLYKAEKSYETENNETKQEYVLQIRNDSKVMKTKLKKKNKLIFILLITMKN
jgi:hypothetical protein